MAVRKANVLGSLQLKVVLALRDDSLCGVDLMERLHLKSSGTIYPVLNTLRNKKYIDYNLESDGIVRKKKYFITDYGLSQIKDQLSDWSSCCLRCSTTSERILNTLKDLYEFKTTDKILCSFKDNEIQNFLINYDVEYSNKDINKPDTFDLIINFIGVGFLWGKENAELTTYVKSVYQSLRDNGKLVTIEFEKSNSVLAQILFVDVLGLQETAGLSIDRLNKILVETGFKDIKITPKEGLLYAIGQK